MNLYTKKDIELLEQNYDKIADKIQTVVHEKFEPTKKEMDEVTKLIMKFVQNKKRKIYGGFALNLLLLDTNPADAIYKGKEDPDIDFYSPEPIEDVIELCNILFDAGYKYVIGNEGLHKETYKIFVNFQPYVDISYINKHLYNRLPYKEIKGTYLIHPMFMMIDYFRVFTDPIFSFWRLAGGKALKRYQLLQKNFPFPINKKPLAFPYLSSTKDKTLVSDPNYKSLLSEVESLIQNNSSIMVSGNYAYNYYLKSSMILDNDNDKNKIFNLLRIDDYEITTDKFADISTNFLKKLKEKYANIWSDIKTVEYYPFTQFWGHNIQFLYKDKPFLRIFDNYHRYLPYKKLGFIDFRSDSLQKSDNKTIQLATFNVTLMMGLMYIIYYRTNQNKDMVDQYYILCGHLMQIKKYFLDKFNKSIFDKTPFEDFTVECIGNGVTPDRERRVMCEEKRKLKKPCLFVYNPNTKKITAESNYKFANTSGNAVRKEQNVKISLDKKPEQKNTSDAEQQVDEEDDDVETKANNTKQSNKKRANKRQNNSVLNAEITDSDVYNAYMSNYDHDNYLDDIISNLSTYNIPI
jgi:hypothetical protein